MRLALAGDVVLTRRLPRGIKSTALAELLASADLAAANLDTVFRSPETPAAVAGGGLWLGSDPSLADELPRLGLGAVSRANNHAGDYGMAGMAMTGEALDAAGIAHAGCGSDLAAARAPRYVGIGSGIAALVSCATTFTLASMAGASSGSVPGRPGISMVRVLTTYELAPDRFDQLAAIADELGLGRLSVGAFQPAEVLARDGRPLADLRPGRGERSLVLLGDRFVRAERTRVVTRLHPGDVAEVLAAVAAAAASADAVVLSVHAHGTGPAPAPAPDVAELARRAVRAGAGVVAVHGDHTVAGIEALDGAVILHGLGNLVFQPETVTSLPAEAYALHGLAATVTPDEVFARRYRGGTAGFPSRPEPWRGLVAVAEVAGRRVDSVTVHPVALGFGRPVQERGDPVLATDGEAAAILDAVEQASAGFGTPLERDGTALQVRLPG